MRVVIVERALDRSSVGVMSRTIFITLAALVVVRVFLVKGSESAFGVALGVAVLGTMVRFSDFWAQYLLAFGFWESKATDFRAAENSVPVVALIGWILLGPPVYVTCGL